ncbi:Enoyl-CoA hydratase/isomerase family protein [Pseudomonas sp. IT-P44]|uniref:enoyl-CoA hydratase/isomerase family protein n=1 Tax=unclassified Pseudomonas TaxID=196821 RepID=UPI00177A9B65|nr:MULTISPECIES: enoyl-CoA hydratase/isomerase family protein [unclassified Pseudomonas]MBD9613609.1 enoyl-CoA hydratase/isomerase family protein [Pseudomonas sp. PDM02]
MSISHIDQQRSVLVEIENQVALVTLNRPANLNAVNQNLRSALITALTQLNDDPAVKAVVLTGAGDRAFCAGQDLEEASAVDWKQIAPWLNAQRAMYQAVRDLDKPCVVAINGVAAGAGMQLALCGDWRVATPDARIGQPEVKAGLASIVGSYLLSLHVGLTHNAQLSLSGELINGQRAHEIGLVTELASDVLGAAIVRAHSLAQLPATAIRLSKQRFRALTQPGFDDACTAGIRAQLECYASGEPQTLMSAFLDARARKGNTP